MVLRIPAHPEVPDKVKSSSDEIRQVVSYPMELGFGVAGGERKISGDKLPVGFCPTPPPPSHGSDNRSWGKEGPGWVSEPEPCLPAVG